MICESEQLSFRLKRQPHFDAPERFEVADLLENGPERAGERNVLDFGVLKGVKLVNSLKHAEGLEFSSDLKLAVQRLVDIANQRDGSDNISAQIVRIQNVEQNH